MSTLSDRITTILSPFNLSVTYALNQAMFDMYINQYYSYVRKVTGLSFNGVETFIEVHDGNGIAELMLDRKPIVSLVSIELLTIPLEIANLPLSAIEVIATQGILRIRRLNVDTYTTITPLFPFGQNNIRVTYTAGYSVANTPDDITQALALMVAAKILGVSASLSGGGVSLSVVSWSKSYGARGKFGEIRSDMYREAKGLLGRYTTGVVGA